MTVSPMAQVDVLLESGRRVAAPAGGGDPVEVVVATAADVAGWGGELLEGVYIVGSGDTGVASTFIALGATYATIMSASALGFRAALAVGETGILLTFRLHPH